jgi:pyruvate formate lyase activating enzyme
MKFIDNEKHMRYTGVSNELILENLTQLAQQHPNVVVRVPLIPGINDSDHDIRALEAYLLSLGSIQGVSILPYHKAGVAKAKRLLRGDIVFFESKLPKPEQIEFLVQTLEKQGFAVTVGG